MIKIINKWKDNNNNKKIFFNLQLAKKEELLTKRELELERQTEECKHLVRISEQRR